MASWGAAHDASNDVFYRPDYGTDYDTRTSAPASTMTYYTSSQPITIGSKKESGFSASPVTYSQLVARIVGTQTITEQDGEMKQYTVYCIEVTNSLEANSWTVKRRYNEFYRLHEKLKERIDKEFLPVMPGKQFFGVLKPDFVEKRKKELQGYLAALCAIPQVIKNEGFLSFLEASNVASSYRRRMQAMRASLDNTSNENTKTMELLRQRDRENKQLLNEIERLMAENHQLSIQQQQYEEQLRALTPKLAEQTEKMEAASDKLSQWRKALQQKEIETNMIADKYNELSLEHAKVSACLKALNEQLDDRKKSLASRSSKKFELEGAVVTSEQQLLEQGKELAEQALRIGALEQEIQSVQQNTQQIEAVLKKKQIMLAKLKASK